MHHPDATIGQDCQVFYDFCQLDKNRLYVPAYGKELPTWADPNISTMLQFSPKSSSSIGSESRLIWDVQSVDSDEDRQIDQSYISTFQTDILQLESIFTALYHSMKQYLALTNQWVLAGHTIAMEIDKLQQLDIYEKEKRNEIQAVEQMIHNGMKDRLQAFDSTFQKTILASLEDILTQPLAEVKELLGKHCRGHGNATALRHGHIQSLSKKRIDQERKELSQKAKETIKNSIEKFVTWRKSLCDAITSSTSDKLLTTDRMHEHLTEGGQKRRF